MRVVYNVKFIELDEQYGYLYTIVIKPYTIVIKQVLLEFDIYLFLHCVYG